jgi:hypothetical protein
MLPSMMNGQNQYGEEVRETAYEGIMQPLKMSAIPHFFSKTINDAIFVARPMKIIT